MRAFFRFVHWYVREITGAAEYDRYLTKQGTAPALSRRDYERERCARHQDRPGSRCC